MDFQNVGHSGQNYYSLLSCDPDEREQLFDFAAFLDQAVHERILSDPRFPPSDLWRAWLSDTIIGFSGDTVLYRSGHRFASAFNPITIPAFFDPSFLEFARASAKTLLRLWRNYRSDSIDAHLRKFKELYPNAVKPRCHERLLEVHPFPYMRSREVLELGNVAAPERLIEVGAGACTNIALHWDLFGTNAVVIDLPDTIFAGYILLKSVFPDIRIALPNRAAEGSEDDYDVRFLLPYQTDCLANEQFDVGFNVSSFQEMDIGVVNAYLSFLRRALKKNGTLILCNQVISRHIEGNCFEAYDLRGFSNEITTNPQFFNYGARKLKGVSHIFYQARKV